MLKQTIKKLCLKSTVLYKHIFFPYSIHCEKRRQYLVDENNYRLNDAEYCLRGIEREKGVNFWFLLEQGHNNIGDIAIGIAERRFFEKYYPEVPKHFIYEAVYVRYKHRIARQIHPGDVIVLRGGGSIGNTIQHEKHREEIIKKYSKQLIVSMPQTMCFPDTEKGINEKRRAAKIYAGNKDLMLIAREEMSYQDMNAAFPKTNTLLTPDIVMSLDCTLPRKERSGILLCFRNDWERRLSTADVEHIEQKCRKYTACIEYTDMYAEESFVPFEEKDKVFRQKIDQFKQASLVITDRLHGMVFCAITGTPCIALSNYNHKVLETAKWLKEFPFIRYCSDAAEAANAIPELYGMKGTYSNAFALPYYEKIIKYINGYLAQNKG